MARLTDSETKVGVVLCHCGGELRKRLDFARLKRDLLGSEAVAKVTVTARLCDTGQCSRAVLAAVRPGPARLVVGGCALREYEQSLRAALVKAGVNDALWQAVNLRDHCARACRTGTQATAKALERLRAAVNRARVAKPVQYRVHHRRRAVAVVGGGIAGLQAAVALVDLGHRVVLVHQDQTLGGEADAAPELCAHLAANAGAAVSGVRGTLAELRRRLAASGHARVCTGTTMTGLTGELGDFTLALASNNTIKEVRVGAVLLATGAGQCSALPNAGLPDSSRILDLNGLLKAIRRRDVPNRVAILADMVGEQDRNVTARVLSAAEILATQFGIAVKFYCRHVRVAASGLEQLYRRTREAGVLVVKTTCRPLVSADSAGVTVEAEDAVAEVRLSEVFDVVVLADVRRDTDWNDISRLGPGLRRGPECELQADNIWLLSVLTNRAGVFVAGAARGSREYREALADGLAAATEIHATLSAGQVHLCEDAVTVDSDKCVLCLTCIRVCPHAAISIDAEHGTARVSTVSCQRCGICAAECPARAIQLPRFSDTELDAEIGAAPGVTVFACENSAVPAADAAAAAGCGYGANVQVVPVPCAGKVDPRLVLTALQRGAERVVIIGCHPESCQYLDGSGRAMRRAAALADMLERAGIDRSKVAFHGIASVEPDRFVEYVNG